MSVYLRRVPSATGGPNRYLLDGLFKALEAMMQSEVIYKDAAKQRASGEEEDPEHEGGERLHHAASPLFGERPSANSYQGGILLGIGASALWSRATR